MTLLVGENRRKRKRDTTISTDDFDDVTERPTAVMRVIDESPLNSTSFDDFRRSTIQQYSSLNWLGPGVMAVHWFKEYLKKPPFHWARFPKEHHKPGSLSLPSKKEDEVRKDHRKCRKQRHRRRMETNSKSHFYFIPGQYLRKAEQHDSPNATRSRLAIQNALDHGVPGVHYATSYVGVYNLLRSYGRFAMVIKHGASNKNRETEMKPQLNRLCNTTGCKPQVFLFDYNGPSLPK